MGKRVIIFQLVKLRITTTLKKSKSQSDTLKADITDLLNCQFFILKNEYPFYQNVIKRIHNLVSIQFH
jgi:hypothetical protein